MQLTKAFLSEQRELTHVEFLKAAQAARAAEAKVQALAGAVQTLDQMIALCDAPEPSNGNDTQNPA